MKKTAKLFLVNLRGLSSMTGVQRNKNYVVANDTNEAYKKVRDWLDSKEYGFRYERELESIELLAENCEYTDVRIMLFI